MTEELTNLNNEKSELLLKIESIENELMESEETISKLQSENSHIIQRNHCNLE